MSSNYYQKREGAQSSAAVDGGYTKTAARSREEPNPNPRRSRVSKERREETGIDFRGGSQESFLFKSQAVTDDLLAGGQKESKGLNAQRERKKLSKERYSKYGDSFPPTSSQCGKISPILKEKVAHVETGKEKGMKTRGVNVEGVLTDGFSSPDPRRDNFVFSGPLLVDVEKTMKAEKRRSTERTEIKIFAGAW
jgi:hypothetical protein